MDALFELSWRTLSATLLMAAFIALTLVTMALARIAIRQRQPPEQPRGRDGGGAPPDRPS